MTPQDEADYNELLVIALYKARQLGLVLAKDGGYRLTLLGTGLAAHAAKSVGVDARSLPSAEQVLYAIGVHPRLAVPPDGDLW